MSTWLVNFVIRGRHIVEVEAANKAEAIEAAYGLIEDSEAGEAEWEISEDEQLGFYVEKVKP